MFFFNISQPFDSTVYGLFIEFEPTFKVTQKQTIALNKIIK